MADKQENVNAQNEGKLSEGQTTKSDTDVEVSVRHVSNHAGV